jgi:hypothetical protein
MLRFILKRRIKDNVSTLEYENFYTLDVDCPELERHLLRGGCGEDMYDYTDLIGVEILETEQKQEEKP